MTQTVHLTAVHSTGNELGNEASNDDYTSLVHTSCTCSHVDAGDMGPGGAPGRADGARRRRHAAEADGGRAASRREVTLQVDMLYDRVEA